MKAQKSIVFIVLGVLLLCSVLYLSQATLIEESNSSSSSVSGKCRQQGESCYDTPCCYGLDCPRVHQGVWFTCR